MRIGHGYDAHRLEYGCRLTLGGVVIEHEKGLYSHSDGDCLVHAVIDALFGAAGFRDIGTAFPDTDEKYKGASSLALLGESAAMLRRGGFSIEYIDCTIIAQAPKMAPHIIKMRENIASSLGISASLVNVKATTEEKMGFTGEKTGIAAHCVCLLD